MKAKILQTVPGTGCLFPYEAAWRGWGLGGQDVLMLGYCRSKGNQLFSRVCLSHRTDKELGQRKGKGNQCGRKESLRGPPPAHTHRKSVWCDLGAAGVPRGKIGRRPKAVLVRGGEPGKPGPRFRLRHPLAPAADVLRVTEVSWDFILLWLVPPPLPPPI